MDEKEKFIIDIDDRTEIESKDDSSRKELLWEKRQEIIFNQWKDDMIEKSVKHGKKGKIFKKRFSILMIPATLLPIVMSGLASVLVDYPLVISGASILTGVLTGLNGFFNYGSKYEKHFNFENQYLTLSREIVKELSKPKRHRPACDVYYEKIMNEMNKLDESAPLL